MSVTIVISTTILNSFRKHLWHDYWTSCALSSFSSRLEWFRVFLPFLWFCSGGGCLRLTIHLAWPCAIIRWCSYSRSGTPVYSRGIACQWRCISSPCPVALAPVPPRYYLNDLYVALAAPSSDVVVGVGVPTVDLDCRPDSHLAVITGGWLGESCQHSRRWRSCCESCKAAGNTVPSSVPNLVQLFVRGRGALGKMAFVDVHLGALDFARVSSDRGMGELESKHASRSWSLLQHRKVCSLLSVIAVSQNMQSQSSRRKFKARIRNFVILRQHLLLLRHTRRRWCSKFPSLPASWTALPKDVA